MQLIGTIKAITGSFGFVSPVNGGGDIFMHRSQYLESWPPPLGLLVRFDTAQNAKGMECREVRPE